MSKSLIKEIHAREILDSRGNPTIEVDVRLEGGICWATPASIGSAAPLATKHFFSFSGNKYIHI